MFTIHPGQHNQRQERSIDSVVTWLIFGELSVLLIWSLVEIAIGLCHMSKSWPLAALFFITALTAAFMITIKLLKPNRPDSNSSGLCLVRTLWALLLLNVITPALAVLTAQTLKPDYDFWYTPLLRLSAQLMNQLLR
jgi:hypothetical protein